VYSREINGQEFTFGVSGKLIRNVLVMYDRQTESYWSQLLGEAVEGELVGTKLEFVPSWMMSWSEWRKLHPDTLALVKQGQRESRANGAGYYTSDLDEFLALQARGGSHDIYAGYYTSGRTGVIPETIQDDRLYAKEFVTGVELDDAVIAYPFSLLNEQPVVNDQVGDTAVLIWFDPETAVSVAFDRTVSDQTLTFTASSASRQLQDVETGSTWDALTGTAVEGPLTGTQLTRLKSTASFWFGWKDIHPDTLLFGHEE
jgi:hypothetical protein